MRMAQPGVPTVEEWLADRMPAGGTLALDGACTSVSVVESLEKALAEKRAVLRDHDFVSALWQEGRPPIPATEAWLLEPSRAGLSAGEKLHILRERLARQNANAMLVCRLDSVAWLLNLRADDVESVSYTHLNPRVAAVKNSSMPVQDIQMFKAAGGEGFVVFNGPDEQFVGGRTMGADGGIGGTYAVMPELFLKADALLRTGEVEKACAVQYDIDAIIYAMCACRGNLYAVMKEILRLREGLILGGVRAPLPGLGPEDMPQVEKCAAMIDAAIERAAAL